MQIQGARIMPSKMKNIAGFMRQIEEEEVEDE